MTESAAPESPLKGRLVLLALFVVFFLPIFLAFALNVELPHWFPFGRSNHGQLVVPSERLDTSALSAVDGAPVGEALLQGKWTLLYVEPSACLAECDRAVYRMRQGRYAMGKDMERVQRLVVAHRSFAKDAAEKLRASDPALNVVAAAPSWTGRSLPGGKEAEIYIIDPQGYLVMWYRGDASPSGLIKDLKRLLKISKIG